MKRLTIFIIATLGMILLFNMILYSSNNVSPSVNVKSGDDFNFYIISDPHYIAENTHDNGEAFNNLLEFGDKMLQYSNVFIDAIKESVIVNKPDFIVFTGDLTINGLKENHIEFSKKLSEFVKLGTCVYVIPGNHDISNEEAVFYYEDKLLKGNNVDKNKFVEIYYDFGYNQSISRDEDSLSYLVMATEDVWLLMIDSTNDYPDHGGSLSSSTLQWIESCSELAKEKNSKMIAVMHHSLIDHSKIISDNYTIENNEEILKCFIKSDIEIVLTGHIHLQDIKEYNIDDHIIYDIATSSLSVYPHQFGTMHYSPYKGYNYHTVKLDMTQYAIDNGLNDEFLIEFDSNSEQFFKDKCCSSQRNCINNIEELNEREKEEVIKVVSEMNKLFFAGYRNEYLEYLKDFEGFKLLESISTCPVKNYALAILNDERANNNIISIPISD